MGAGRFADEAARLRSETPAPEGWNYLWFLGRNDIFRRVQQDGRACVACHTHRDVAILQHDVVLDVAPGTRIAWDWKVDELPSPWREDTALTTTT